MTNRRMDKGSAAVTDLQQRRDVLGRFSESVKDDPGQLVLESGELALSVGSDGTFEFPPGMSTAAEGVAFWMRVPISDDVLVSTVAAYDARQARDQGEEMGLWELSHPKPASTGPHLERWKAEWERHRARWQEARDETHPEVLPRMWVRPLVRVVKVFESAAGFEDPAEREKVHQLVVALPGGTRVRVADIVRYYRLDALLDFIKDYARDADVRRQAEKQFVPFGF